MDLPILGQATTPPARTGISLSPLAAGDACRRGGGPPRGLPFARELLHGGDRRDVRELLGAHQATSGLPNSSLWINVTVKMETKRTTPMAAPYPNEMFLIDWL